MTRGTATGKLVAGHRVDAVITGHIGRKATAILRNAGIRVYIGAAGKISEVIDSFKSGRLAAI
ncbi:MAG: NifB/NifX family molybdenum-iron cluster-binding protein [Syntrophales bacterium]